MDINMDNFDIKDEASLSAPSEETMELFERVTGVNPRREKVIIERLVKFNWDKDFYIHEGTGKKNSQCKVCSDKGKTRGVFIKEGWFRGDDTYLGKLCDTCIFKLKHDGLEIMVEHKSWFRKIIKSEDLN